MFHASRFSGPLFPLSQILLAHLNNHLPLEAYPGLPPLYNVHIPPSGSHASWAHLYRALPMELHCNHRSSHLFSTLSWEQTEIREYVFISVSSSSIMVSNREHSIKVCLKTRVSE